MEQLIVEVKQCRLAMNNLRESHISRNSDEEEGMKTRCAQIDELWSVGNTGNEIGDLVWLFWFQTLVKC